MPCSVPAVSLPTSWRKLCDLHDHSHRYVASHFSSSFCFSTNRFLAISVAMYLGIVGVHFPLNIIGTIVSKSAKLKAPFRAQKGGTKLQDQVDPLVIKETLETHVMRWWCDIKIAQRQRMEQRRGCMCWSRNLRNNRRCIYERMNWSRNRYNRGWNMHSWMKLCPYNL